MIIHYILFFVTVLFAKAIEKTGKTVTIPNQEDEENRAAFIAAMFAYIPVIIMLGLRDNMGDTDSYIETFNISNPQSVFDGVSFDDRNPGYTVISNFFKLIISDNANFFLLFLTFISVLLMVKTQSKYSPFFAISTYVFFGSTEISYVFNGARQFLAISIMFYSFKFMKEKKLIKYAICAFIAFIIHQTAVVVIPAYFVVRGKFLNKKIILAGMGTIAATAFSSLFINYLNDLFISDSVYSHYYDQLVDSQGINIFRVFVAAIPVILCLIYKKRIDELEDDALNISANMSFLAVAISIFSATSGGDLLGRLAEYYLIFNTLTYPMLLKRVVSKNVKTILEVGLIIGFFLFFFYQFTIIWEMGYQSNTLGIAMGTKEA